MKHIFIVNPISGKGKTLKTVDRIKKVCEEEHLDYKIHYTEYPKEATKIARKYRFSKNIIYSVGGDGTLNEVLNGIVGTKNLLGVIPSGSGNDFYKTLSKIDEEKGEKNPETSDINLFLIISLAALGTLGTAVVLKNRLS